MLICHSQGRGISAGPCSDLIAKVVSTVPFQSLHSTREKPLSLLQGERRRVESSWTSPGLFPDGLSSSFLKLPWRQLNTGVSRASRLSSRSRVVRRRGLFVSLNEYEFLRGESRRLAAAITDRGPAQLLFQRFYVMRLDEQDGNELHVIGNNTTL